jgi:hypothetical protein
MNTTTIKPRWPIRPLTWREGCEILRTKFTDHAHWLIVIHGSAARLLIKIEERYYAGEKNQGFTLITGFHRGLVFAVVAAKKRHMPAYKLASMLRQYTDIRLSEREILSRDLLIVAPDWAMNAATELAFKLLSNDDLAMAE